jgi:hypothetical protein
MGVTAPPVVVIIYIIILLVILIYSWIDCYTPIMKLDEIHDKLLKTYTKMKHVFEDHAVIYFAGSGTLLGAIRSESIIPHDDDMDFCVLQSEEYKLQKIDFGSYGLKIQKHKIGYRVYDEGSLIFIDLFIFKKCDGKYIDTSSYCRKLWPMEWYYESEIFPLKQHRIGKGMTVPCPCTPIPFFERFYGTDWEIPRITHIHHRTQRHMAYYPVLGPSLITVIFLLSASIVIGQSNLLV